MKVSIFVAQVYSLNSSASLAAAVAFALSDITTMASFMQIPEECLLIILARADLQSLCHVSATCQYMRTLIKVSNQINMHACIFKNVANCNAVGMLCSHASVI